MVGIKLSFPDPRAQHDERIQSRSWDVATHVMHVLRSCARAMKFSKTCDHDLLLSADGVGVLVSNAQQRRKGRYANLSYSDAWPPSFLCGGNERLRTQSFFGW